MVIGIHIPNADCQDLDVSSIWVSGIQMFILCSFRPAIRSVTFSDVENSLVEKEEAMLRSTSSMLSATTTTSTEYFSAISSDEDDEFYDIQADTEVETESEESKDLNVSAKIFDVET